MDHLKNVSCSFSCSFLLHCFWFPAKGFWLGPALLVIHVSLPLSRHLRPGCPLKLFFRSSLFRFWFLGRCSSARFAVLSCSVKSEEHFLVPGFLLRWVLFSSLHAFLVFRANYKTLLILSEPAKNPNPPRTHWNSSGSQSQLDSSPSLVPFRRRRGLNQPQCFRPTKTVRRVNRDTVNPVRPRTVWQIRTRTSFNGLVFSHIRGLWCLYFHLRPWRLQ